MILRRSHHRILLTLCEAGRPVKLRDLAAVLGRSNSDVCVDLRRLRAAGLVESGPRGSRCGYWLRPDVAVARREPRAGIAVPIPDGS